MHIISSKKWDIESIITHEYRHNEICKALEMDGNTNEALSVVIKF